MAQPPAGPFQIDANFGLVGNVLAMLVTNLPQLRVLFLLCLVFFLNFWGGEEEGEGERMGDFEACVSV